ncbi:MAG: nickel pincer cofactor biosynthesis protein LarC [Candidatus Thermoplasmatota archaeon]|nr:nickel pincer cofactor biosynthesis protein LarC [Candidatus Thermoplasmatota archaeon]
MKKIAYFELESGISGDMLLGSLIDLGGDVKVLDDVIKELELKDVHIEVEDRNGGVKGKNVRIRSKDQPHRKVSDIIEMIKESGLDEEVKERSIEAFEMLGEVEADIHDESFEDLELHETGMVDSIIDIVGSIALFFDLEIEKAYSSTVSLGEGYTECEHGRLPVPVPATERLLKDWEVDLGSKEGELVTPSGAVLLRVLTEQEEVPDMKLKKIGVGFGSREMETPNALRIFLGLQTNLEESVRVIRFYVDDMSPEILGYAMDKIREKALDAYMVPSSGKKGRQGWEVNIIVEKSDLKKVIDIVFDETSTLGLRIEKTRRVVADRETESVQTDWGEVKMKVAFDENRASPEYESCRKIAEKKDVPLKKVYEKAKEEYEKEK